MTRKFSLISVLLTVFIIGIPAHAQRSFACVLTTGGASASPGLVSMIDLDPRSPTYNTVVAWLIPVGHIPDAIATSSDGRFAYITSDGGQFGYGPDEVSVISTASKSVVATLDVGPNPLGIAAAPHGHFVYVAVAGSNSIAVIDTTSNTVVDTIPLGSALNSPQFITIAPNGRFAYVTAHVVGQSPENVLAVIDLHTKAIVATVELGQESAGPLAVTPDGRFIYAAGSSIAVISTQTHTVMATIPSGTSLGFGALAVTPDGSLVYTSSGAVLSTKTNTVVSQLPMQFSSDVAFSKDGSFAYFVNDPYVSVLEVRTNTMVASIGAGFYEIGIAITPPLKGKRAN